MTNEEIEKYYELLGFEYVAMSRALFDNDLVDDEWREEQRKNFFARLAKEHRHHSRRVWEYEQTIRTFFSLVDKKSGEYVSLTDIARKYSQDPPGYTIQSWMRSKNTIAYLRIWELIHNYYFDDEACAELIEGSSKNSITLTPSKWIASTKAIGIRVKRGKGGGVEAHEDISLDFRLWMESKNVNKSGRYQLRQLTSKVYTNNKKDRTFRVLSFLRSGQDLKINSDLPVAGQRRRLDGGEPLSHYLLRSDEMQPNLAGSVPNSDI